MALVESSKLSRLPILIFYQVLKNILAQLAPIGISDEVLMAARTALQTAFDKFDKVVKQAQGSVHTQELLSLDGQRDALIQGLELVLRGYVLSTIPAKADAARVLLRYLDAYGKRIENQAQIKETAIINNLIQDFQRPDAQAAASEVPLADWETPLREVNTQFENLYSIRAADLDIPEVGQAKAFREETQYRFDTFVSKLNALMTLATTPNPKHEQAAAMINTEVKTAKTNVKKGGGGKEEKE